MKRALAALLILTAAAITSFSETVLIVADEWPQMEILKTYLEDKGSMKVEMAEQDKMPANLSGYLAVFEFVHGMLNDEPAAKMMDYCENGGRLIVLHHGVSAKKKQTKGWYDFLGMELDRAENSKRRYVWIKPTDYYWVNLNPGHYITSNKVNYPGTIHYRPSDGPSVAQELPAIQFKGAEVFINHQFTDAREKTALYGFHYVDPESGKITMQDRGGWLKRKGEGWLFYFQPGDVPSDMENKNYCQVLLNALTWKP